MTDFKSLRGLKSLVLDAVEHGASAVERVHLQTAHRTFDILKKAPPIEAPVEGVQAIHDSIVSSVYASVRLVSQVVGKTLDAAIDVAEQSKED
jgi:hypothetical protein